jgi:hypothetical protein
MRLSSLFETMARIAYAARGIVLLAVGAFLVLAALKAHRAVGSTDALRLLLPPPFGTMLLATVAIGLLCFAAWRLVQALLDADRLGTDLKGLARRVVYAVTGLFYIGFAAVAFTAALGWESGGGSDQAARDWTAWLLGKPFGQWLTGAIGLAIVATGLTVAAVGLRGDFKRRLELKGRERLLVGILGAFGFVARAVVFTMIGVFSSMRRSMPIRAKRAGLPGHCAPSNTSLMAPCCLGSRQSG